MLVEERLLIPRLLQQRQSFVTGVDAAQPDAPHLRRGPGHVRLGSFGVRWPRMCRLLLPKPRQAGRQLHVLFLGHAQCRGARSGQPRGRHAWEADIGAVHEPALEDSLEVVVEVGDAEPEEAVLGLLGVCPQEMVRDDDVVVKPSREDPIWRGAEYLHVALAVVVGRPIHGVVCKGVQPHAVPDATRVVHATDEQAIALQLVQVDEEPVRGHVLRREGRCHAARQICQRLIDAAAAAEGLPAAGIVGCLPDAVVAQRAGLAVGLLDERGPQHGWEVLGVATKRLVVVLLLPRLVTGGDEVVDLDTEPSPVHEEPHREDGEVDVPGVEQAMHKARSQGDRIQRLDHVRVLEGALEDPAAVRLLREVVKEVHGAAASGTRSGAVVDHAHPPPRVRHHAGVGGLVLDGVGLPDAPRGYLVDGLGLGPTEPIRRHAEGLVAATHVAREAAVTSCAPALRTVLLLLDDHPPARPARQWHQAQRLHMQIEGDEGADADQAPLIRGLWAIAAVRPRDQKLRVLRHPRHRPPALRVRVDHVDQRARAFALLPRDRIEGLDPHRHAAALLLLIDHVIAVDFSQSLAVVEPEGQVELQTHP
mmetsp:Transcript_12646/g.31874  ORF Transcript_12646/g.31874 Transcript_12646/m.31874 type:complete len:591 (-) Transcript_12646:602-2374(-)